MEKRKCKRGHGPLEPYGSVLDISYRMFAYKQVLNVGCKFLNRNIFSIHKTSFELHSKHSTSTSHIADNGITSNLGNEGYRTFGWPVAERLPENNLYCQKTSNFLSDAGGGQGAVAPPLCRLVITALTSRQCTFLRAVSFHSVLWYKKIINHW